MLTKLSYKQIKLVFLTTVIARRFAIIPKSYTGLMLQKSILGDKIAVILGVSIFFYVCQMVPYKYNK